MYQLLNMQLLMLHCRNILVHTLWNAGSASREARGHGNATESPFVYVGQPLVFASSGTHPLLAEIVEILTRLNVSFPQYIRDSIGRMSAVGAAYIV